MALKINNDLGLGVLYRYEAVRHSICVDPYMEIYATSSPKLNCSEYGIIKITKRGFWIKYYGNAKLTKWVSAHSRKRFAHFTKEQALEAYMHRKLAYVKYANQTLTRAKEELRLVKKESINGNPKPS